MVKNDNWITRIMGSLMSNFRHEHVNPSTYDFTWSGRWSTTLTLDYYPKINTWIRDEVKHMWIPTEYSEFLTLEPRRLYLLDTQEEMQIPEDVMGLLFLKSSIARAGLEHLHAGLFDPGYGFGNPSTGTLEVINLSPFPLVIKRGQRLVQMAFFDAQRPLRSYVQTGRYNGEKKPTA